MASTHKLSHKQLKRPDGFLTALKRTFGQIEKRSGIVIVSVVAVLGIGVAVGSWMNHRDAKAGEARNALYLADQAVEEELRALVAQTTTPDTESSKTKKSKQKKGLAQEDAAEAVIYQKFDVDAKVSKGVEKLKAVEKQFSGTRSAYEARLKLGLLYFQHGDFSKAISWYEKAYQSAPQSIDKAYALSSLGYAYENLGKSKEAVDTFQKAIHLGHVDLKGDLLLGLARGYEALHDTAQAKNVYDQILKDLPNTEYAKSAEVFKTRL